MTKADLEARLAENPLLARLARESQAETMTFWGYIGPSTRRRSGHPPFQPRESE